MNQFPQALFRAPGVEMIDGHGFTSRLVRSLDEREAALREGWHEDAAAALAAHEAAQRDDSKPATREELEQKAAELGVPFGPRVSDKKLAEAIAAKLAA